MILYHGSNIEFGSIDLHTIQYFFGTEKAIQTLKRL